MSSDSSTETALGDVVLRDDYQMTISSRTPEGFPARCVLCGADADVEFSEPAGDVPCPKCGCLLWQAATLWERLRPLLSAQLGVPADEVRAESALRELAADSLDLVELVMALEEESGLSIPDDDYEQIRTVGDLIRYILKRERLVRDSS
jgi:acyl carrier protein